MGSAVYERILAEVRKLARFVAKSPRPDTYDMAEAARAARVSRSGLRALVRSGRIIAVDGRIPVAEVAHYLARREEETIPSLPHRRRDHSDADTETARAPRRRTK